jgi:putative SOS response-associated peptidase YedK
VCGRFVSSSSAADLAAYFGAEGVPEETLEKSWNVAPTNDVFVVHADGGVRRIDAFHWGLVPLWAKDPKVGSRMINARSETLASKGAFKPAFRKRRCIVPADGFYEWKKVPGQKQKQPYFIHRSDGEPYAFAGLWETWRGPDRDDSQQLRSTTIITTSANESMAAVHDRMPVILPPSAWDEWLDPADDDIETLGRLLVPAPPHLTVLRPVGTGVNHVRNKGSELIEEVEPPATLEQAATADADAGSGPAGATASADPAPDEGDATP